MSELILKRHQLVELPIPANSSASKFPYPDIPQLRDDTTQDIIIAGLQIYTIENAPKTPNGNTVGTTAQLVNLFLTLYIDGEESVNLIPVMNLQNIFGPTTAGTSMQTFERLKTDYLKVDWNKSYYSVGTPYLNNAAFSVLLSVYYKKLPPGTWDLMRAGKVMGW